MRNDDSSTKGNFLFCAGQASRHIWWPLLLANKILIVEILLLLPCARICNTHSESKYLAAQMMYRLQTFELLDTQWCYRGFAERTTAMQYDRVIKQM